MQELCFKKTNFKVSSVKYNTFKLCSSYTIISVSPLFYALHPTLSVSVSSLPLCLSVCPSVRPYVFVCLCLCIAVFYLFIYLSLTLSIFIYFTTSHTPICLHPGVWSFWDPDTKFIHRKMLVSSCEFVIVQYFRQPLVVTSIKHG